MHICSTLITHFSLLYFPKNSSPKGRNSSQENSVVFLINMKKEPGEERIRRGSQNLRTTQLTIAPVLSACWNHLMLPMPGEPDLPTK